VADSSYWTRGCDRGRRPVALRPSSARSSASPKLTSMNERLPSGAENLQWPGADLIVREATAAGVPSPEGAS
jgi:hypothetical protein